MLCRRVAFAMLLPCAVASFIFCESGRMEAASVPDFARDVKPIFESRCVECHGPQKQKNGFRLDRREDAMRGGDTGAAIIPGDPEASLLIRMVTGTAEGDAIMPPKGDPLSPEQIETLKRWIAAGAKWDETSPNPSATPATKTTSDHWAFQPISNPTPPTTRDNSWPRSEIDRFVLARLESKSIAPSPEADRRILLRRVSLDLTGLPPTPDEIETFLKDDSADAFEKVVDRLLASPHFGERWGRHWLDHARYADSDGYEKDLARPHAWRWREWVIGAMNADMPYDQFTIEQIAGDLLPNATIEQRAATGFHRNTLLNREGGVDLEEDRNKNLVDRLATTSTVWLGLTVGCAECHTHKYDPITHREFYRMMAFFNNADERDILAPLPRTDGKLESQRRDYERARDIYLDPVRSAALDPAEGAWEKAVAALPQIWTVPTDYGITTFLALVGANLNIQEDESFLVTGTVADKDMYTIVFNTQMEGITGIRIEAMTDEMLPRGGPGWAKNGNFVLSEFSIVASPMSDTANIKPVPIAGVVADYSQPNFEIAKSLDGITTTGWAVDMPQLPMHGIDRCAVYELKEPLGGPGGTLVKAQIKMDNGGKHAIGRLRLSITNAPREQLAAQAVPGRIREIAAKPNDTRASEEQATLKRYFHSTYYPNDSRFVEFTKASADWLNALGETYAPTLAERTRNPRATHIHLRGDFLRKGDKVEPGVLEVLNPFKPEHNPPSRLDLAKWIVAPENPLTARVAVNHLWQHLFGDGLVRTPEDFGTRAEAPAQPELLDWLAREFVREGWSRKKMIRRIVLSATYRQDSKRRPELDETDPYNFLLARQNRFRLDGEAARDQFLAASGLLNSNIGGTSFRPNAKPPDRYRRGLYLFFQRSQPDEMLMTFDAPNSTNACTRRERSNTPLQALTTLNDPVFFECARALAARTLEANEAGMLGEILGAEAVDEALENRRMRYAFALASTTDPSEGDLRDMKSLLNAARTTYQKDSASAEKLLGDMKRTKAGLAETAAWVVAARAILNADRVMTRE